VEDPRGGDEGTSVFQFPAASRVGKREGRGREGGNRESFECVFSFLSSLFPFLEDVRRSRRLPVPFGYSDGHCDAGVRAGTVDCRQGAFLSLLLPFSRQYRFLNLTLTTLQMRGYRSLDFSDSASLRTTTTGVSFNSFTSTSSGSPLTPPRNTADVGNRAVMLLLGHDYELLTFSIGERQLVKRRYPARKSAVLTPPIVYFLIGDSPAIVDATNFPHPTCAGFVPPHKEGDSMYAVTSVLTPAGVAKMHGECLVVEGGAASVGGSSVQVNLLPGQDEDDEKVCDPVYRNL
jgi:hypothetical protein